jgi:hypothetical protein
MGNYSRSRITMGQPRQIYFWARDEIGFRPQLAAAPGNRKPSLACTPRRECVSGVAGRTPAAQNIASPFTRPCTFSAGSATVRSSRVISQ